MNPPTNRNDDRLDNVHSLAVTEFKEDVFVFRWNIRNFKERLNQKDPKKAILWSPLFTFEEESKNERQWFWSKWWSTIRNVPRAQATKKSDLLPKIQWQLRLKWSCAKKEENSTEDDNFLSVFLYLKTSKEKKTINTIFQIDLLDSEKKSRRKFVSVGREFKPSSKGSGWRKYMNTRKLLDPKNKLLEDDTLKLQCRVIMKRNVERQLSPPEAGYLTEKSPMFTNFSSIFTSSICTDVLLKTKGSTFKAHKAILSWRSPVFFAMFQTEMVESIQNVVEIADFDDEIVKLMLEYIYGVEISQGVLTRNSQALFQIADKYDIKGLKDLVEEVLVFNLSVKTVVDTLILADMNSTPKLKARAMQFVNMNKEAVKKSDDFQKLLDYIHNPSIFKELFTNE